MLKISNITLLIAFILGFFFAGLFRGCGNDYPSVVNIPAKPSAIEKQVAKDEAGYKKKEDSLNIRSNQLAAELKNIKKSLEQSGRKNLILQTQLSDLAGQYHKAAIQKDTIRQLESCDSLVPKMSELVESYRLQDSLCGNTIDILEQQVAAKDSLVQVHEEKYNSLKLNFEKSVLGQQLAIAENKQLHKQIARQKRKGFLTAAIAVIASGLTLRWLIKK